MATILPVQTQNFSLSGSGSSIGDTVLNLKSFKDILGVVLTMANFGTIGYGTLEPGNGTQEEQISFSGVTQNSDGTAQLTGVKHVLFKSPFTETSGMTITHPGSVVFVISNTSGYENTLLSTGGTQTVSGKKIFPSDDVSNAGIVADTDTAIATAFVTLGQLSRTASSGASNASTTVKGIVQEATQTQIDARTASGSTLARLYVNPSTQRSTLISDEVDDSGSSTAYVITPVPAITAYTKGQRFTTLIGNANTTTTPTLNVSGVGAKTIKKNGTLALAVGDLPAGAMVEFIYDGTNMQVLSGLNSEPTGSMKLWGASSAPAGYVLGDGSAISRTGANAALFAVYGTTYGSGNGTTTFNVPDFRGRVPVGVGTGTGGGASGTGAPTGGSALTAVSLGTWKGEESHTMTTAELVAHTHTVPTNTASSNVGSQSVPQSVSAANSSVTSASEGGSTAFNVIQPVMGVNIIIKL